MTRFPKPAPPAAPASFTAKATSSSEWLFFAPVNGIDGQKLAAATAVDKDKRTPAQQTVVESYISANRQTLKVDSFIPATMAVIYLLLLLYFKAIGGYKPVHLAEELTGGTTGPMEA